MSKFSSSFYPYEKLYNVLSLVLAEDSFSPYKLSAELVRECKKALLAARHAQALPEYRDLVDRANRKVDGYVVQIDDEPHISKASEGAYISAWVWVPFESKFEANGKREEDWRSSEVKEEETVLELLTEQQRSVYKYVRDKADQETMEDCVSFENVYRDVGIPAGWSRLVTKVVLGSLVSVGCLIVETRKEDSRKRTFYLMPQQHRRLTQD